MGKQLKEYEEKTNELLAKVNDLEKKVDELQDELRIKQEKVVKGKELTKNLVEKIERLTSEISDDQQLLRENKKEKKLPEMPDQTSGASLLLPLTSKDKDSRSKEENHKLLNGNSGDLTDRRQRTQVNGKNLEDGNTGHLDTAMNGV
ncbi:hypothetical protein SO802_020145 [Lithocarpus litseifolius]|uniref:Uncharacterized protein n=1 Tax=Lithocarpus litseifolius TaxID=425828 RepID=A0AAW2CB54_9ROSI